MWISLRRQSCIASCALRHRAQLAKGPLRRLRNSSASVINRLLFIALDNHNMNKHFSKGRTFLFGIWGKETVLSIRPVFCHQPFLDRKHYGAMVTDNHVEESLLVGCGPGPQEAAETRLLARCLQMFIMQKDRVWNHLLPSKASISFCAQLFPHGLLSLISGKKDVAGDLRPETWRHQAKAPFSEVWLWKGAEILQK